MHNSWDYLSKLGKQKKRSFIVIMRKYLLIIRNEYSFYNVLYTSCLQGLLFIMTFYEFFPLASYFS